MGPQCCGCEYFENFFFVVGNNFSHLCMDICLIVAASFAAVVLIERALIAAEYLAGLVFT